jgi:hypothetical protein
MLSLSNFIRSFFSRSHAGATSPADQDYLSGAVDIHDLERRMRAIDDGRRHALSGVAFGQFLY